MSFLKELTITRNGEDRKFSVKHLTFEAPKEPGEGVTFQAVAKGYQGPAVVDEELPVDKGQLNQRFSQAEVVAGFLAVAADNSIAITAEEVGTLLSGLTEKLIVTKFGD